MSMKLNMEHVCGMTRLYQVEKKWALLSKIGVLRIVDFWQIWKNAQLQQCITSSILNFWKCSWTFLESLRCPLTNPFGLISF